MTGRGSLAERVLMVPVREVAYMLRGLLYAVAADPVAAIVFGLLVLSSWPIWKALKAAAWWIDQHLPVHRGPACDDEALDEFDRIVERYRNQFSGSEPTQELPEVVRLDRHAAGPFRELKRRRMSGVRIPGRRARHRSTSSSDRRPS